MIAARGPTCAVVLALVSACASEPRAIPDLNGTWGHQRVFGLEPPPGTRTIVDLDASWVVDGSQLLTAPGWSPFQGMRVWGRVREVRVREEVAFDGERVTARPGSGRDLAPC